MKKILASLLFWCIFVVHAQEPTVQDSLAFQEELRNSIQDTIALEKDTIVYHKNTKIATEREFTEDLKEKYKDKDFEYKEDRTIKKEVKPKTPSNFSFLKFFAAFMTNVFPFLLGAFVIFVILKSVLGLDTLFWKSSKKTSVTAKKLIYEEEDINELNITKLLQQAIDNKEYRLAIRYYYLATLKELTNKKLIDYHKDKTNSEYLFEIENVQTRNEFSYLSYVYSYVWYGEFPVDENSFFKAQNKYQSFLNSLV